MPLPSYAQNFEDVMLWRLFKNQGPGFYVDVGAQDPEIDSVTRLFYDQGWSGMNIEPVQLYFDRLKAERTRDINLAMLVGAQDGEATFFNVEGTGLSTTREDLAKGYASDGLRQSVETLPIYRLQTLFERHGIRAVDFLKVDTEGSEADVLLGLDFSKIRPKVLVIESTLPNSRQESHHLWEPRLLENGYHLAYRDGLNRFYLDAPYLAWKTHFELPPNHFDDFTPALAVQEQKAAARYQRKLEADIATLQTATTRYQTKLETDIATLQCDLAARTEQVGRHHRLIIETLQDEIARRDQHIGHVHGEIARLRGELDHIRHVHEWAVRTRSWRWTEPLRRVLGPLERGFGAVADKAKTELQKRRVPAIAPSAAPALPALTIDGLPEAGRWLMRRLARDN